MKTNGRVIYGVFSPNIGFIEVSLSKGAAKRHVNKHGYDQVWAMSLMSNVCWIHATKTDGLWNR